MDSLSSAVTAGQKWFARRALTFKLLGIGALALVLLIPLAMVNATRNERQGRYNEAVTEVTRGWGGPQALSGPFLVVPYTYRVEVEEWVPSGMARVKQTRVQTLRAEAFFAPREVTMASDVAMSVRQRGIYRADVFTAKIVVNGTFARPDLGFVGATGMEPQWEQARLCFGLSQVRGVQEVSVEWGGERCAVGAWIGEDKATAGLEAAVTVPEGAKEMAFSATIAVNGSGALRFVPGGEKSVVRASANWPDPSFNGTALPTTREVTEKGFTAEWRVGPFGREFPAQWTNQDGASRPTQREFEASAFGVRLTPAVNGYRLVERATKYGLLFVALVFGAFFLFEALCGLRLHGLNYLLVGGSVCLFFLGLLALSELVSFGAAYALSAGASLGLVAGYAWAVLRSGRRAAMVSALLATVYGYVYLVLGMEDFALAAGTGALFVLLGLVMWVTRGIKADARAGGGVAQNA